MVETSKGRDAYTQQLQEHLRTVLRSKATGSRNPEYAGLLQDVTSLKSAAFVGGDEAAQHDLCDLLDSMTACISALHEQRHAGLISEIFSISLWDAVKELRASILCFMLHVAVVSSTMTLQILQVLVLNLGLPWALAAQQVDRLQDEWQPLVKADTVQADIIATLEKILELVPVSGRLLLPILARGLPNKVVSRIMQCTYLRAMLAIAELPRAAPLRKQILAAVVQHLVSLDVEIRWQDIAVSLEEGDNEDNEESDEGEEEQEDIFELEGTREADVQLDPSKFQEQGSESAGQPSELGERMTGRSGFEGKATDEQPSTSGREELDETAEKLDSMMAQVFHHISKCRQEGQLGATWQALLESFFATVLNTHRSKFTQYLLWYILDMDPERGSREFLGKLLQVLADTRQPAISRSAAASYVASFLARAAFLSDQILMDHISRLACWCQAYCQRQELQLQHGGAELNSRESKQAPPQGIVHQVFYAACQGLLYVLCYRVEQLAAAKEGSVVEELRSLFQHQIPFLLESRLSPLSICLPTVVSEFSKLTAHLGLLNCQAQLPDRTEAAKSQRPLEMFFPFDPYLLRRSASFLDLQRTFLKWKGSSSDEHEEDGEGNSEQGSESDMASDDEDTQSGSSSSGLESGSKADSSEAGSEKEDITDAFRALTPEDYSPVAVWRTVSQPIKPRGSSPMPESLSTNGNSSPACPMSWTAKLPHKLVDRNNSVGKPLDASQ